MGFEPTISAGEWPKTYALDRAATGTGKFKDYEFQLRVMISIHIEKLRNFTNKIIQYG